jgi:cold shock protein
VSRFDAPGQSMTSDEGFQTKAVVKWFNGSKGFGFVAPADGSADAFLHISVLNRSGMQQIAEGTELTVRIARGAKGPQVIAIVQVHGVVAVPGADKPRSNDRGRDREHGGGFGGGFGGGGFRDDRPRNNHGGSHGGGYNKSAGGATGPVVDAVGTVKWFKPDKGFGFVTTDDGDKDVFVHKNVLRDAGMNDLQPGQRVRLKVQTASKGREATSIAPE